MATLHPTKALIIERTLTVLKQVGMEGLTMRKVATEADMSLGNLQYHYKDKAALLSGLADTYFEDCLDQLRSYTPQTPSAPAEEQRVELISFYLDHVDHLSDMCRVFRELWALSTRDAAVEAQMNRYYTQLRDALCHLLNPLCGSEEAAQKVTHLLLPYFEGYSITHDALSISKPETAHMLRQLCESICRENTPENP